MEWYAAKMLHVAFRDEALPQEALAEETIRVFRARDMTHAAERAEEIGRAAAVDYPNEAGEIVDWRFVRVVRVVELNETTLEDGAEVYSTLFYVSSMDELTSIED